ncbi:MAG: flippase-like domain-containing protein [Actinobacteria bacterium]|nr:flippase-like domain-containing protein [Actinomycetota bacterium]
MNLESQNKKSNKKRFILRIINIVVVVGFGAFLVYYLLGKISIGQIKDAIVGIDKPSLIIALVVMFISVFLRTYRKKILVGSERISMTDMFLVVLIRNAFNMVLPARTGELSYVYVLQRKFKFPLEIGVSTLMIVLVFDLVIVFSLIVISIIVVLINKFSSSYLAVVIIALALLVILLLVLFYFSKVIGFFLMIIEKILARYRIGKNKAVQAIYKKMIDINKNIEIIQKRKIYWKVYLSSIVIRILKFVSYYMLIYAILRPEGYGFKDLNFWIIFLAVAAAEISAVLPTHALAGFGTYEGAFLLVLGVLGFTITGITWEAVAFGYHIITLAFIVILGLIAMIILSMPFYKVKENNSGKL